jgi:phosphomannomutase
MNDPIKVYDARWEAHEFSDAEVSRLFEAALIYGRQMGVDTVVLTRDARLHAGRALALGVDAAMRGGFTVFADPSPCSTPQSYHTTLRLAADHSDLMGLTVTASHNPAGYVGVKFTVPIVQAIGLDCGPEGGLSRVRTIYHSDQSLPAGDAGQLHIIDQTDAYIHDSLEAAGIAPGDLAGVRVVLDTMNGSAGPALHRALRLAGVQVIPHRLIPDGTFPTGSPNPTSQGKLDNAIALATEHDADLLIGVDGDGDRLVFGDGRGILTAGFAFVAILQAMGIDSNHRPPVLYDPKVNPLALVAWRRQGVRPVLFRNGHSQIKDYMTRINAVAAAEESGHYYHRFSLGGHTVSYENSLLTVLLMLRSLRDEPSLLDDLWRQQGQIFTTGEFNYQCSDDAVRDAALDRLVEHFKADGAIVADKAEDGSDLQGICLSRGVHLSENRTTLADDWFSGYIRVATNEKGVVRCYFSSGDQALGRTIEQQARQLLEERFAGKVVE